ncbi:MAG: methionine synthase [candidate division KSB1 bacterium]|nr:methionine synthase [candidate division KSB1 bacterium]
MTFLERIQQGLVVFDGAMGTQVHAIDPTDEEWDGRNGCPEVLNFTVPEKIQTIHENYFNAGSDVVETNTFGGSGLVLAEFDLQNRTEELNETAAKIARRAADQFKDRQRFVIGSMGPGTKLITLGQTDFETLHRAYFRQAFGLLQGGVDGLIIETCQDLLQVKTVLIAAQDAMRETGITVPRIVSVTIETTGSMLVGSDISAVLATLQPFDVDVMGMNCATGPEPMRPYIKQICEGFLGPVIVQPNAGMPENRDGEMVYTLPINTFSETLADFVKQYGVNIVGGCCGTHPGYIEALYQTVKDVQPAPRQVQPAPALASLFSAQTLGQEPRPFYVGERSNTNGSKVFRERLLQEDWDGIVHISRQQEQVNAHGLDLCVAYTGRDEQRDMIESVTRVVKQVNLPIFIDSTSTDVMEAALQRIPGRPVINSVNLEDGEERADRICGLAKRFGAALIALPIDEQGMAKTVERKVQVARRIYDIAVNRHGLCPQDLIYDALTFTLGSGDKAMKDAGRATLDGLREIKKALPGVYTVLGVSNISFGLSPYSREVLNSVFMAEAVKSGLDLAIVNVKKIIPLYRIDQAEQNAALDLIYNRGKEPLFAFIRHFEDKSGAETEEKENKDAPIEEKIKQRVIQGNRSQLDELLTEARESGIKPVNIINQILIPAMKVVGDLFGAGKMQLPFVLQSAEVMKHAVADLEPYLEKKDVQVQKKLVLATVRGDVHDIGKNLVDIILSNNGYKVYNLGIKCEIDTILDKVNEVGADAIGMSGLLVKSTVVMQENLQVMKQRGVQAPVLLGGAALTKSFVNEQCAPILEAPVVYCSDAFEGLRAMSLLKAGDLHNMQNEQSGGSTPRKTQKSDAQTPEPISRDINIPEPPFWGTRVVTDIDLNVVYSYLTESVLFRGRWGYRRGKMDRDEYNELIENTVKPQFEDMKAYCRDNELLHPRVVYGYFPCSSSGEDLIVYDPETGDERVRFYFPRQKKPPYRSISDFFTPESAQSRDVLALQVVTVGDEASERAQKLYENDKYKDYLLFHGFTVETAEALAEYWHKRVRMELDITEEDGETMQDYVVQKYRGSRYSFGYPACPDLSENRKLFQLLQPERIGVTLTDGEQMVPEQSTSAVIVHHPEAKYFSLE